MNSQFNKWGKCVMKIVPIVLGTTTLVGGILTGCGSAQTQAPTSNPTSTVSSSVSNTGNVTITFWNRWPEMVPALNDVISGFEKAHPNITVKVTQVPASQVTAQLQAAISGNSLPDIFPYNTSYTLQQLVQLGVAHNLDDILTSSVQSKFIPGTFAAGYTTLNNHAYELPLFSGYHYSEVLYYNKSVLKQYGMSNDIPRSWAQLQSFGQQIKTKSNGKVYGTVIPGNTNWATNGVLLQMATAISPQVFWNSGGLTGFNFSTGQYDYTTPGILDSMKFIKSLYSDGTLYPNSIQDDFNKARADFESGKAAYLLDGTYQASSLVQDKFSDFGVAPLPTKGGAPEYDGFQGECPAGIMVSQQTKHYTQVKLFLNYMIDHFYPDLVKYGVSEPPINTYVNTEKPGYPQFTTMMKIQDQLHILSPNLFQRNPATVQVMSNATSKDPKTNIGNILQGYLSGQVSDSNLNSTLSDLAKQYNASLDNAIKGSGGKVTNKDFVFSNWTSFKPYNTQDYSALSN